MKKKANYKKLLLKAGLLCLIIYIYLIVGAYLFMLIESDYDITSQRRLFVSLVDFANEHPCWSNESIQHFFQNLSDAISGNVISATRSSKIRDPQSLWDIPTSFFFATTIVTTIGYGNFVPVTSAGQIFCSLYALFGIPLAGGFLFFMGVSLQGVWLKVRLNIHRLTTSVQSNRVRHFVHIILYSVIVLAIEILLPGLIISFAERWSFADSVYYCFISLSTIGFGDMVAGDGHSEAFLLWLLNLTLVMYLLTGLCVMSMMLKALADSEKKGVIRARTFAQTAVKRILRTNRKKTSPLSQPELTIQVVEATSVENLDADCKSGAKEHEDQWTAT